MIEVRNLSVSYFDRQEESVLHNLNLSIPTGGSVVIIGPSGTGKSTFLKALAGLQKNYTGEILLDGKKINPVEHTIGYLPQNFGLLPWLNLRDNIMLGQELKRSNLSRTTEPAEMITRLGLDGLEDRFPHEVSGGQRQRAALARVFLLQPDLLLMDEPFSALDAITREEMQLVFFHLWQRYRITAVIVTHFVEEAIFLGQKIVVLSGKQKNITATYTNEFCGLDGLELSEAYLQFRNQLKLQLKDIR